MSDIGKVRTMLRMARKSDDIKFIHRTIDVVLPLLDREQPQFKAARTLPPLTVEQVHEACELRGHGWPLNRIARHLGTNIGRVSEAINGLREGV